MISSSAANILPPRIPVRLSQYNREEQESQRSLTAWIVVSRMWTVSTQVWSTCVLLEKASKYWGGR